MRAEGQRLAVYPEHFIKKNNSTYRADVYVVFFTSRGKVEIVYEVQKRTNCKDFLQKMRNLGVMGEIIDENVAPDNLKELEIFVQNHIILP